MRKRKRPLIDAADAETIALTAKFLLEQSLAQRGSGLKVIGHTAAVVTRLKPQSPNFVVTLKLWDPRYGPSYRLRSP